MAIINHQFLAHSQAVVECTKQFSRRRRRKGKKNKSSKNPTVNSFWSARDRYLFTEILFMYLQVVSSHKSTSWISCIISFFLRLILNETKNTVHTGVKSQREGKKLRESRQVIIIPDVRCYDFHYEFIHGSSSSPLLLLVIPMEQRIPCPFIPCKLYRSNPVKRYNSFCRRAVFQAYFNEHNLCPAQSAIPVPVVCCAFINK